MQCKVLKFHFLGVSHRIRLEILNILTQFGRKREKRRAKQTIKCRLLSVIKILTLPTGNDITT